LPVNVKLRLGFCDLLTKGVMLGQIHD
jgi:hypothetical protein